MRKLLFILSLVSFMNLSFANDYSFDQQEHYVCKSTNGLSFDIYLDHLRATRVEVDAFGNTFYGNIPWWSKDIKAKAKESNIYEPETLHIKKNRLGYFYHMTVFHNNGRAPWVFKISCQKQ